MGDSTTAMILRELIAKYDEKRKMWVERYGTDEGFNEWFTNQITKM